MNPSISESQSSTSNTTKQSSVSQVYVITPKQLANLGLSSRIESIAQSQRPDKPTVTDINPSSTNDLSEQKAVPKLQNLDKPTLKTKTVENEVTGKQLIQSQNFDKQTAKHIAPSSTNDTPAEKAEAPSINGQNKNVVLTNLLHTPQTILLSQRDKDLHDQLSVMMKAKLTALLNNREPKNNLSNQPARIRKSHVVRRNPLLSKLDNITDDAKIICRQNKILDQILNNQNYDRNKQLNESTKYETTVDKPKILNFFINNNYSTSSDSVHDNATLNVSQRRTYQNTQLNRVISNSKLIKTQTTSCSATLTKDMEVIDVDSVIDLTEHSNNSSKVPDKVKVKTEQSEYHKTQQMSPKCDMDNVQKFSWKLHKIKIDERNSRAQLVDLCQQKHQIDSVNSNRHKVSFVQNLPKNERSNMSELKNPEKSSTSKTDLASNKIYDLELKKDLSPRKSSKLQIVSNEVVNFSIADIKSILNSKISVFKSSESVSQDKLNMHSFKPKTNNNSQHIIKERLYQPFHVADCSGKPTTEDYCVDLTHKKSNTTSAAEELHTDTVLKPALDKTEECFQSPHCLRDKGLKGRKRKLLNNQEQQHTMEKVQLKMYEGKRSLLVSKISKKCSNNEEPSISSNTDDTKSEEHQTSVELRQQNIASTLTNNKLATKNETILTDKKIVQTMKARLPKALNLSANESSTEQNCGADINGTGASTTSTIIIPLSCNTNESNTNTSNETTEIFVKTEPQIIKVESNAKLSETVPKKRGRKRKSEIVQQPQTPIDTENTDVYVESKTSGRRRKLIDYSVFSGNSEETPIKKQHKLEIQSVKKVTTVVPEQPELTQLVKSPNVERAVVKENTEIITKEQIDVNQVTCAICLEKMNSTKWSNHRVKMHNNLAWRTSDPPLDLQDRALVMYILNDLYKKKIPFNCDTCGMTKKSVQGFLSHKQQCFKLYTGESSSNVDWAGKTATAQVVNTLFKHRKRREKDPLDITAPIPEDESVPTTDTDTSSKPGDVATSSRSRNEVKCAVCNEVILKKLWSYHKQSKHNNLAWKVGEPPLDLENQTLVVKILSELYKAKKPLTCEECGIVKKSVIGFLSHKTQCLKSEKELQELKVKCELCQRTMLPVSLSRHMALSHSNTVDQTGLDPLPSEEELPLPLGKRKAANKAIGLIHNFVKDVSSEKSNTVFKKYVKNVNFRSIEAAICKFSEDIQKKSFAKCVYVDCQYRTSEHEELFQHIENCTKRSETNYTCNFCLITYKTRHSVLDHIKSLHLKDENFAIIREFCSDNELGSDAEVDDHESDDSYESEFEYASKTSGNRHTHFLDMDEFSKSEGLRYRQSPQKNRPSNKRSQRILFLQKSKKPVNGLYMFVYWWMQKFCQENYDDRNIFPNVIFSKEDWVQVNPNFILKYLPKLKMSIDTARIRTNTIINPIEYDYEWKKFKLFESEITNDDGTSTTFCGGPVNAMAWVPTPYNEDNCDQILAISILPDPDKKYHFNSRVSEGGLIQFWNFGQLQNKDMSTYQPKLEFCIAHDYGIIWAMEWCPSGCYDVDASPEGNLIKRLGLLAVACSDTFVYIFQVIQPGQLSGSILESKPKFRLQLEDFTELNIGETNYHSTRLSWTKASGHRYIAAGYSNGMVGIYDLKAQSSLLKQDMDDLIILKPVQTFKPHIEAISALSLYHLNNGKRWLVTGSMDRDCKLWDLENVTEPLNSCKKFIITDAVWLLHWLCTVYSYDHGCISGSVPTSINPARDFHASVTSFMPSNSRVTSVSANEWGNIFIQANDCGEVICGFPDQLLQAYDSDKRKSIKKARSISSYTGMVEKFLPPIERINMENKKVEALLESSASKNVKEPTATDYNWINNEPRNYPDIEQKYGLVFCDLNMDYSLKEPTQELNNLLKTPNYFSLSKPDVYPIQSINKVASNPNKDSFLYYACGYQAGFVRVRSIKFLCPRGKL